MNKFVKQLIPAVLVVFVLALISFSWPVYHYVNQESGAADASVKLQLISNNIPQPVAMNVARDGSNGLFICEKFGRVWLIQNGKSSEKPFLDVSDEMIKVNPGYDERGLLGIAFHPNFKTNRKFYVYYSVPSSAEGSNHKSRISEFQVAANNPGMADKSTKRVVMEIEQPESNHNGGDMVFGPDGFLYIALGDGGGGGDKHGPIGNGQNLTTLLGKILRIDVNGNPYTVPKDNPFVNNKDIRPEIWAYGLRNPWRISFDKQTKQLFAGDVGQNKFEEVDIIEKGGNYGWRVKEGLHEFNVPSGGSAAKMIDPIHEYSHSDGISIAGGYVYRGNAVPELKGKYVYGDYNGKSWLLTKTGNTWANGILELLDKPKENMQILSWGEDEAGELYVLANLSGSGENKGGVYKLVK